MNKTLLFVGLLIIILVMLSGNVQEGLTLNEVISLENQTVDLDADLKKLVSIYDNAVGAIDDKGNTVQKSFDFTLKKLVFSNGSTTLEELKALVAKYNAVDSTFTMKLVFGVATNKLSYKVINNHKSLFKSYYNAATNKSETISINNLTFPPTSREEYRLFNIVSKYTMIPTDDPLHMEAIFTKKQILDRFDAGLAARRTPT